MECKLSEKHQSKMVDEVGNIIKLLTIPSIPNIINTIIQSNYNTAFYPVFPSIMLLASNMLTLNSIGVNCKSSLLVFFA